MLALLSLLNIIKSVEEGLAKVLGILQVKELELKTVQVPSSIGEPATLSVNILLYIVSPICSELFIGCSKVIVIVSGIFLFF
jgi:hypothetical protein|tara:strand:+ start:1568 stop:1813 length:246 start_codon:yes stop_codon:yes gene_type:complete